MEEDQTEKDHDYWQSVADALDARLQGWTFRISASFILEHPYFHFELNKTLGDRILEMDGNQK